MAGSDVGRPFSKDMSVPGLTDEQIKQEQEFLKGIPRINIGALLVPPVWGPAHGMWATVLFYPLWLFVDNAIYAAYTEGTIFSIIIAVLLGVSIVVGTMVFSLLSQPFAAHRAAEKGIEKERYLRNERIWAIVGLALAIVVVAWASYFNIAIRPTLG